MRCRQSPYLKPWLTKDVQTAAISGCLQLAEAGGSRDAPSSVTLAHAVQCQLIPLMESDTIAHMRQTSFTTQRQTKSHSPARSWEASLRRDKRRYGLEIAPAVQCYTRYSDGEWERNIFMSQKMIMPSFPQRRHKRLLISCRGPHPRVSWSATVWFITLRKGTHLTYRREHKQPG